MISRNLSCFSYGKCLLQLWDTVIVHLWTGIGKFYLNNNTNNHKHQGDILYGCKRGNKTLCLAHRTFPTGCLRTLFQLAILTEMLGEGKDYAGSFSHQQWNEPTPKGIMLLSLPAKWTELVKSTNQPKRNKT